MSEGCQLIVCAHRQSVAQVSASSEVIDRNDRDRHRRRIAKHKKLVIVTRKTRLQELVERFNTRSQAKFYIERAGGDFADYEREDDAHRFALKTLRRSLDFELPQQPVDRSLVPTFHFQKEDLVAPLGQDGLVANTAKYVRAQPIVAVNPEPDRLDGILLPFLR